jgi:transketolase
MRNAFIDELVTLARQNPKIILMVGDLGFSVVEPFQEEFPDRFFNAGVAEQNMMGMAAGLASEGCHVFIYSIANFPTFRCAEQIRNDVAYHNLPVTIVSVGGGLSYGNLGYSHHAIQDYALMRIFPNMLIAAPGDPQEVRACMRYLNANPQPSYLRLGKAGEKNIHQSVPDISPGVWCNVFGKPDSQDDLILTTGNALQIAISLIERDGFEGGLASLPLWGMDVKLFQPNQCRAAKSIFTFEDHLFDGGFGSWMLESLIGYPELMAKIKPRTLNNGVLDLVASQDELHKAGGLMKTLLED